MSCLASLLRWAQSWQSLFHGAFLYTAISESLWSAELWVWPLLLLCSELGCLSLKGRPLRLIDKEAFQFVSGAVIRVWPESSWEFIWLTVPGLCPLSREVRSGMKQRPCYLLAYDRPAFLHSPAHLSRDGAAHSGLDPSTSTTNQENASHAFPQNNLMRAFS